MDYKTKYLKYKNKYLELKNKQRGGITGLPAELSRQITSFLDCKDFFRQITGLDRIRLNSINWDTLPEIPINVAPQVNLNIDCVICNRVEDEENKQKCKIYYNKCKLLHLCDKYMEGGYQGQLVNIQILNDILIRTIPHGNSQDDQNYLIHLGANLTTIDEDTLEAFMGDEITTVTIPNSITIIGQLAFNNYDLTSVTIPNSVTTIGYDAFSDNRLTTVIIPDSVTTIETNAFSENRLTTVTISNSVTFIGNYAFANNRLTSVIIPVSVTTIGMGAFMNNRLRSVVIPDSVTTIDHNAFANNLLKSVTIPNSVTTIRNKAFFANSLRSVTMPSSFQDRITDIFGSTVVGIVQFTFT